MQLCQEYVVQSQTITYRIRPRDEKRPLLSPVGGRAQFRMEKDKMTGKTVAQEEIALLTRETQALFHKNGSWQQQLVVQVGRVVRQRRRAKSAGQS
jgi:hypothetical protein